MRPVVGVLARVPRGAAWRPRLSADLGPHSAAALSELFVRDELDAITGAGLDAILLHDAVPPEAERVAARMAGAAPRAVLPGPDLAADWGHAFARLCEGGRPAAVVTGDVPQLRGDVVWSALGLLERADVVFGPCPDGGFWLAAMRELRDLFSDVALGTAVALSQAVARARSLGLTVALGGSLRDVDRASDLEAIRADLPERGRTRRALDAVRLGPPADGTPPVRRLHLELTNRCNLACAPCAREALAEPARDLSPEQVRRIVEDLPELRSVALQVNGEPLVYPFLDGVLATLRERRVQSDLCTHGLLLDERRRRVLIDGGLGALHVSLDAATPEGYRRVRGVDRFDELVANAAAFARERGAPGPGRPRLSLWMIATRATLPELPRLVALAGEIGADEVYLQRLVVHGRGLAREADSLHGRAGREQIDAITEAAELAVRLRVALVASGGGGPLAMLAASADPRPWRACRRPFESAVVLADGDVVPCCIATFLEPRAAIRMGNVLRDGWPTVWNGPAYARLRRRLAAGDPPSSCLGCGVRWSL